MNILLTIVISMIWFAIAISIMSNIVIYAQNLEIWKWIVICIVIIIGAPFMLFVQALETILNCFLEEGWNDDDEDKFGH